MHGRNGHGQQLTEAAAKALHTVIERQVKSALKELSGAPSIIRAIENAQFDCGGSVTLMVDGASFTIPEPTIVNEVKIQPVAIPPAQATVENHVHVPEMEMAVNLPPMQITLPEPVVNVVVEQPQRDKVVEMRIERDSNGDIRKVLGRITWE